MSGNPPPSPDGGKRDDGFVKHLEKLRATVAILDVLAPFDANDRRTILIGAIGASDDTMGELLARGLSERFKR